MHRSEVPGTAIVMDDDDECNDDANELDAVTNDSSAVEVVDAGSISSDSDWGTPVNSRSTLSERVGCPPSSASGMGVAGSGSSAMDGRRSFPG